MTRGDAGLPLSVLTASLLCAAALAAAAQPAPPPAAREAPATTVGAVTVTAKAPPRLLRKQAGAFVEGRADTPKQEVDQVGRWRGAVCVEVVGLPQPEQAQMIKGRIEGVAAAVGLPRARKGCRANVEIVFTDQPQRTLDVVAEKREYLLGYDHRRRRDRLKTVTRPIQAWYVTATRADGANLVGLAMEAPGYVKNGFQDEVIDDPVNLPPAGCGANPHFTSCLTRTFFNVFIVADSKALQGRQTGLLADYLAVLALSRPRLDGCEVLPSVIDLFASPACRGREPPDGLTRADAAYLTSLYASDADANRTGQQADIAGRMARILVKADAGAE